MNYFYYAFFNQYLNSTTVKERVDYSIDYAVQNLHAREHLH